MVTEAQPGRKWGAEGYWDLSCPLRPHWGERWGTGSLRMDSDRWVDQESHSPYCETPSSLGSCRNDNRSGKLTMKHLQ